MKRTRNFIRLSAIAFLSMFIGCVTPQSNAPSLVAVGNGIERVKSYVDTAEHITQAVRPETTTTGRALLAVQSEAHFKAKYFLDDEANGIAAVNRQLAALAKDKDAAVADVQRLRGSLPWRIGSIIVGILVWILILVAVHVLLTVLAIVLPPPWSMYASVGAKIVNPFGWVTWLLSNIERNRVVREVVTDTAAHVEPTVPWTPPTAAAITAAVGPRADQ